MILGLDGVMGDWRERPTQDATESAVIQRRIRGDRSGMPELNEM